MNHRDSQFTTGRIGLWTNANFLTAVDSMAIITQEDAK